MGVLTLALYYALLSVTTCHSVLLSKLQIRAGRLRQHRQALGMDRCLLTHGVASCTASSVALQNRQPCNADLLSAHGRLCCQESPVPVIRHDSPQGQAVLRRAADDDTYQTPQLLMRPAPSAARKPAASHSVTFASSRPSPDSTLDPSYHDQRNTSSSSGGRETGSSGTGCGRLPRAAVSLSAGPDCPHAPAQTV